ncbi:serine protease [Kitasatospora sp. NPDC054939]
MPDGRDGDGVANDPGRYLLRIHDPDGEPRGLGFATDPQGTVLTAHETVAGLDRLLLHTPGGQTRVLGPESIRPLPEHGLALLRTAGVGGLPVPPLPVAALGREYPDLLVAGAVGEDGRPLVLPGTVHAATTGGYAWDGRFHLLDGVLLVDLPPGSAGVGAVPGAPLVDLRSGAVVAVAVPAVRSPRQGGDFPAVPLVGCGGPGAADGSDGEGVRGAVDGRGAADGSGEADGPGAADGRGEAQGPGERGGALAEALAEALARNAATVPAYGPALNLAGVLRLTAVQLTAAHAGPGRVAGLAADRVDRPDGLPDALFEGIPERAGGGSADAGGGGGAGGYEGGGGAGGGGGEGSGGGGGGGGGGDGGGGAGSGRRAAVTVLVGEPGSGRSTELAALAVRRASGPRPLPTLWLRGADLRAVAGAAPDGPGGTTSEPPTPVRPLSEALGRALTAAGAAAGTEPPDPATAARICAAANRPLLVILDGPEEAPAPLGPDWLSAAAAWLDSCGARLLTACGPEAGERLTADRGGGPVVAVHHLGPLPAEAAERVRRRYGAPAGPPSAPDARHPLALRLAGELAAEGLGGAPARRSDLFSAYLDLCCLRIAERMVVAEHPRRPGAHRRGTVRPAGPVPGRIRRLAAAVAGRVHEAARRMLGAGHGGALGRRAFEDLFPVADGWAAAVLAEGLFVPAGTGYRPAHGEFGDWLQGLHLDLDAALRLLLGEEADTLPSDADRAVPRHRVGPVSAALRRPADMDGAGGARALDPWLHRLHRALELRPPGSEPAWWAGRLLTATLAASPDPAEHRLLLEQLSEQIGERARTAGGFDRLPVAGLGRFGPEFWTGLGLPLPLELDLLRRLVPADGPGQPFLTAVAGRLRAHPAAVLPLLCTWFADPRPLLHGAPEQPADSAHPSDPAPRTVADLAHVLLYAHRSLALDDLTEALAGAAHPGADALLARLAADEPSAVCRAVDRWSHDPRPERHVAAAVHALRAAPHARGPGRELLCFAAQALLAREDEPGLHGAALAVLIRVGPDRGPDRAAYLSAALELYARGGDAFLTAPVLAPALETDPEPVLAAFTVRLPDPGAVGGVLRVLAGVRDPLAARRSAELVGRLLRERPDLADPIAADYLGARLDRDAEPGPAVRLELRLLLGAVLAARSTAVRRAFAAELTGPGPTAGTTVLRRELLGTLLAAETDPLVLTAVLERVAEAGAGGEPARVRALVARVAAGLPGADGPLVQCAARSAPFARLLADWPDGPPYGAGPARPSGPLLDRMRALLRDGRTPREAAAEAVRGPVRTAAGGTGSEGPRPTRLPVPKQSRAHGTL